jgi:hypothetical protein
LSCHPKLKRPFAYKLGYPEIGKYIIRKSIQVNNNLLLPDNILWRQTNPLVNSFNMNLNNYFNNLISDSEFNSTVPHTNSKEQMYYRKIFDKYFPNRSYLIETLF